MTDQKETEMNSGHSAIHIKEDEGYDVNDLYTPEYYKSLGRLGKIVIPNGFIKDRVRSIALKIHTDYHNQNVHVLCILKGAITYFNDLADWLRTINSCCSTGHVQLTYDFLEISSYVGMESVGSAKIKLDGGFKHLNHLKGRHVLVVEDMIDTGTTMEALIPVLQSYGPASLKVTTLLLKRLNKHIKCGKSSAMDLLCYVGFTIPNEFIVGYGMDVTGEFRDLEHICTLNDYGKSFYKNGT